MGRPDASSGEMRGFPLPSRPGSELGEPLLDALLDRQSLPLDAPEEAHAVAAMLADLTGPAEPGELAGEAAARLGLARAASPAGLSAAARQPPRHRRRSWSSRSARPAAALIAVVVALGGGTVAAYAGALPPPIQDFAHHAIGAPPARHAEPPRRHPGPADTGPKAHGRPWPVTPGQAKGHDKPRPGHARDKDKGHAWPGWPEPPGHAHDKDRGQTWPGWPGWGWPGWPEPPGHGKGANATEGPGRTPRALA